MAADPIAIAEAWTPARKPIVWGKWVGFAALIAMIIVMGAPLYWLLTAAFKTNSQIYTFPPVWIPTHPDTGNFHAAWNLAPFDRFYVNTIIITFAGTGLELLNATLTAYALSFIRFPGRNIVFLVILATLMVPDQITILPNYLTVGNFFGMNWINTYQGIVLPGASVAFGTFLLRQGFLSLPREVIDAGRVDGAGHFRLMVDIAIPMVKPILVTFGLISMVAKWNDYLWPLIVTNDNRMRPLAVGLSYLFDPEGNTDWGVVMAGTIFVLAPLVIVYIFAQRFIIEGIAAGATKG